MGNLALQLGLGLLVGAEDSVPGAPDLVPLYSDYMVFADGVVSEGAVPGFRNGPWRFLLKTKGRVRPATGWMQAKSGSTFAIMDARKAPALGQAVAIAHFGSSGANDNILQYDPAVDATQMNLWNALVDAFVSAHNGRARLIVIDTTMSSTKGSETAPLRAAAWAAQLAHIATKTPTGDTIAILAHDLGAYWNPSAMSPSSDASRVHPDKRGGKAYGDALFALVDPHLEAETRDNILADTTAKAWRGANIYADYNLSGTGGTRTTAASGTTPTGDYATGQRITNRLASSAAVACSKAGGADPRTQVIDLSGTPAARETVIMDDTANVSLTGSSPGALFMLMYGLDIDDGAGGAPVGLMQMGMTLGSLGNIGSTADPTTGVTSSVGEAIDTVVMVAPGPCFGGDTSSTNPAILNSRWEGSVAIHGQIRYRQPQIFQVGLEEVGVPIYLGDDTIVGVNLQARLTGTGVTGVSGGSISAGSVGTVRCDPGKWGNGAASYATCFTRVLKKNGVVVSGAFASAWTYAMGGQVANGDTIELEVTMTNSFGSTTKVVTYSVVA